jgi:hypothetical protein
MHQLPRPLNMTHPPTLHSFQPPFENRPIRCTLRLTPSGKHSEKQTTLRRRTPPHFAQILNDLAHAVLDRRM